MFNQTGSSPAGGQWCPASPFEIGAPLFHIWPSGCCIHPILYFKNVVPLLFFLPLHLVFGPPLLLNLGDGPATTDEISQPSRPISPRAATATDHNMTGSENGEKSSESTLKK